MFENQNGTQDILCESELLQTKDIPHPDAQKRSFAN